MKSIDFVDISKVLQINRLHCFVGAIPLGMSIADIQVTE